MYIDTHDTLSVGVVGVVGVGVDYQRDWEKWVLMGHLKKYCRLSERLRILPPEVWENSQTF